MGDKAAAPCPMSTIEPHRGDAGRIVARWGEALTAHASGGSDREGDSANLRLELAYDPTWKLLQRLPKVQGLEASSPRQEFSAAFRLGWNEDESVWFDIFTARNQAMHVYREATAAALASEQQRE